MHKSSDSTPPVLTVVAVGLLVGDYKVTRKSDHKASSKQAEFDNFQSKNDHKLRKNAEYMCISFHKTY